MSLGLIGRKVGMMRIFTDDGDTVPVTILDMSNNRVAQIKTQELDGYQAIQIAYGKRRPNRVTKPLAGHFAKAGIEAARGLKEFTVSPEEAGKFAPGGELSVEIFQIGQKVDVSGTTQGKGFSGAIKRHHFKSNRASHGNSRSHNSAGSIGQAQDPGRVFPGKKMAGRLGGKHRTALNLEIVRVDTDRQLLLIKGAIPGSKGNDVWVRPSVKVGG